MTILLVTCAMASNDEKLREFCLNCLSDEDKTLCESIPMLQSNFSQFSMKQKNKNNGKIEWDQIVKLQNFMKTDRKYALFCKSIIQCQKFAVIL